MFMLARRAFSQSTPPLFNGQEFLLASPEEISWFCLTSRQCPRVETALRARGSGPVQENALRIPFLSRQCISGAQAWGGDRPRRDDLLTTMSPILGILQVQTPDLACSNLFLAGPPRGTTSTVSPLPWLAGDPAQSHNPTSPDPCESPSPLTNNPGHGDHCAAHY